MSDPKPGEPQPNQIFRVGDDYGSHVRTEGDSYVLRYLRRDKRKGTFTAKIADCDGDPRHLADAWGLV